MKRSIIPFLVVLAFSSPCYSQDDPQKQLLELLQENRELTTRIGELEKKIEELTKKLAQYEKEDTISTFTFDAPSEGQSLPPGQYFTCKGTYSSNTSKTVKTHVWLFLMDEHLDGYYLQGPVQLLENGGWEGRIRPGTAMIKLAAIQADKKANQVFLTWLRKNEFGKKYILPDGARIISELRIRIE